MQWQTDQNMDNLREYEELKNRIAETFFVHSTDSELVNNFGSFHLDDDPAMKNVFLNFKTNITSVISVASIPFEMATTWTKLETYKGFFRGEMILSTPIRLGEEEYKGMSEKEIEAKKKLERIQQAEKVRETTMALFQNEISSMEGVRRFYINTFNFISDCSRGDGVFVSSARNLINQATLLTWSAFEVLFRDFFIVFYNSNFNKIESILKDNSLKQRFNIKNIPFEKLMEYNFDLSQNMGDVLIENYDFSNLEVIRTVAAVMFDDENLIKMFKNDVLWELYQRRNLIVHRGGISDKKYLEKTADDLGLGEKLYISPTELLNYLILIKQTGIAMFKAHSAKIP